MRTVLLLLATSALAADFEIRLDRVRSGYDGQTCWVHARAGAIFSAPKPSPGTRIT